MGVKVAVVRSVALSDQLSQETVRVMQDANAVTEDAPRPLINRIAPGPVEGRDSEVYFEATGEGKASFADCAPFPPPQELTGIDLAQPVITLGVPRYVLRQQHEVEVRVRVRAAGRPRADECQPAQVGTTGRPIGDPLEGRR
jgi:hypothetical protein